VEARIANAAGDIGSAAVNRADTEKGPGSGPPSWASTAAASAGGSVIGGNIQAVHRTPARLGERAGGRAAGPSRGRRPRVDGPVRAAPRMKQQVRTARHAAGTPRTHSTLITGNNDRVTAAPAIAKNQIHSLTRPNMVSVGTIVWLSSELMFFAALFAMYFSIRATDLGQIQWAEHTKVLNLPYALTFTIILVLSSVTCQMGVFAAERGDVIRLRKWFTLTFLMGLVFVLGQVNEYRTLVHEGVKINADGYGTMFYLTTGFHGLHVTGGLIAFIFFMVRTTLARFTPAQATAAIVVSYYWHFVDLVWIALFAMIYFLQ
jgi:cytochrome c oxidase subunit 3